MYLPFICRLFVGGVVRGGVARPLAAVGRRTGQVSGRAERGWSFWLWLCVLDRREGRGQSQKPSHRGRGKTKIPKIPKIPIVIDVIRCPNNSIDYYSRCYWEVEPTPVILHGSRHTTKLKKKSYNYILLLIIINILCYKCNIIVYKCNVST